MKTLIKEYKDFYLYEYKFNNGNSFRECQPKWQQKDFGQYNRTTPEEKMEKHIRREAHHLFNSSF